MNIIIYRCTNNLLLNTLNFIKKQLSSKQKYFISNLVNRNGFQVSSNDGKFTVNVIGYGGTLNDMDGIKVDYFNSYDSCVSSYLKSRGGDSLEFEASVIKKISELIDTYDQEKALEKLKNKINSVYGIQSIIIDFDDGCIDNITLEYPQKSLEELKEINKIMNKRTNRLDNNNLYSIGSLFGTRKPEIEKVIFSGPCTIVLWNDGDKTIVRCENENFDKEKGLAMAIAKKFLGTNTSKSNYCDIFKKWITKEENTETKVAKKFYTVKELSEKKKLSVTEIRRQIKEGLYPGAIKQSGVWLVPLK